MHSLETESKGRLQCAWVQPEDQPFHGIDRAFQRHRPAHGEYPLYSKRGDEDRSAVIYEIGRVIDFYNLGNQWSICNFVSNKVGKHDSLVGIF